MRSSSGRVLAGFLILAGCTAASPPSPGPAPTAPPLPTTALIQTPLPADPSCEQRLEAVHAGGGAGADPGLSLVLPPPAADGLPAVELDRELRPAAAGDLTSACLLLVERQGRTPPPQPRRATALTVRSEYRTGTRSRPNPDYEALKGELAERNRDGARAPRIQSVGDPSLDLIGAAAQLVLTGISAFDQAAAGREQDRLQAMPRTVEEPRYEPYAYEVTRIEAARAGTFRVTLLDRRRDQVKATDATVAERRFFDLARGRRDRDRAVLEGADLASPTLADVAAWENAPPRPRLSALIEALLQAPATSAGEGTTELAAPDTGPATPAASAPPPQPPSAPAPAADLLEIAGDRATVLGFAVAEDLVLTSSAAMARSSLVRIRRPGRPAAYGLAETEDDGQGLMLIRSSLPSLVLPLHAGADPASGSELRLGDPALRSARAVLIAIGPGEVDGVEQTLLHLDHDAAEALRPGTPVLHRGGVLGIVVATADGGRRILHHRTIERFLAASGISPATAAAMPPAPAAASPPATPARPAG